jgi:hypothetical protein
MNKQLLGTVKSFFEDLLGCDPTFDMGQVYEYVQSVHPDTNLKDLGEVMGKLKKDGEIAWEPINPNDKHSSLRALPPPNPQVTVFGATGAAKDKGTRRKSFSKKQKAQALQDLQALPALTPTLEQLYDWLYGQVHG